MNEYKAKISSFDGRGDMDVVLKRPSVLSLAMAGKIPNPLLSAAARLFDFAPRGESANLKEIGEVLHIIASASLVEPAYDEIKDCLTDTQLTEIYHYAKEGADGLDYFRKFREFHKGGSDGKSKREVGKPNSGN